MAQKGIVMGIVNFKSLVQGDIFSGIACLKQVQIALTKNGNEYATGTFINSDNRTAFKIWNSHAVEAIKNILNSPTGFKPCLVWVSGKVGMYNNALDYVVEEISTDVPEITSGEFTVSQFLPSLDCAKLYSNLCEFINTEVSPEYIRVLMLVMNIKDNNFMAEQETGTSKTILELLKTAWAASGNHDSISGGLMNHTLKMLRIAKAFVANNSYYENYKNLLYSGIILHDIGKTQEIQDGVYTRNSFVSHRVMGIEYLSKLKSEISNLIGVDNYYRLLSIIIGHHDSFGTPADTVWAYLVHLIDMLDTWGTMVSENAASGKIQAASGDYYMMKNGTRLYY